MRADPQKKIHVDTYAKSRLLRRIIHFFTLKKERLLPLYMHTFTYTSALYPFNLISFCFFRLYLLYLALYVGCICTLAVSLFLLLSSVVGRPSSSVGRRRHLVCVCMCEKVQYKSNSPGVPLCTRFGDFGNPSEASYANRRTCTDRNSTQVLQTCGRCNFSCIKPIAQGSILGTL